jgi:hypothetical protein
MTNALQRLATAKPIQPKLSLPAKQSEPSVFDPRLNVSVAGRINPKEALGKLPTVLKEQAAKLPGAGSPLDQAGVGKDLASRQQGSKALEQRMKDGSGLGRSDSFGLVEPASKLAKDDILNKPDGRAPQARVGGVQQRDKYTLSGDSFLMNDTQGQASSGDLVEGSVDGIIALSGLLIGSKSGAAGAVLGLADGMRTTSRDLGKASPDTSWKAAVDLGVGYVGNVAGVVSVLAAEGTVAASAAAVVGSGTAGYAIGTAADKATGGFISDQAAKGLAASLVPLPITVFNFLFGESKAASRGASPLTPPPPPAPPGMPSSGYETADGGKADASTLQKVNILQKLVNPNRPLGPDSDPRNQDPLVNPGRADAADTVHPASPDKGFFAGVDAGVICPGPDQFKALVSPGQVDFLTGAFQQKTDALINPARNDDGSVGGPSFGAPGRVSAGQAGFNAISADGLSERNVADFVLTQGAAAHGFQSISTDGLSERPVVGFSLGQVPSAANGFQAISTDGLSERNGVGQAFMAATQGSASADPFAPATPITPVF